MISHDGDGCARRSGVYADRQVKTSVYKSVRGVVKGPFDAGLGQERPERLVGFSISKRWIQHFETKRGRVGLTTNPRLNGAPF